jgi:cytosol alanyl aminopeptidase
MWREVHATPDRLDRRNLMIALFSFGDPALARRGLALLLDPAIDIREASTALGQARAVSPPSREPYDFLVAHFDALAGRVDRDAPGTWPRYAAQLCSAIDRESVSTFWNARAGRYAGAERELAQTLESIDACAALRTREARSVNTFLAQYR